MNTDVEDLLREGMERFTADLQSPAGIVHRAARQRRRRVALRSTAGATALAATAAAMALVLLPGSARDTGATQAVDTAYVVQQVSGALNAAEPGDIAQMTITTTGTALPGGKATATTVEEWSYDNQWRLVTYSSPGHPAYDEGTTSSSVYTLVSYQTKTWARQPGLGRPTPFPSGAAAAKHGCAPAFFPLLFRFGLPGLGSYASSLPSTVATALRTAVSCGTLEVAGRQQVDGVGTIELKSRPDSLIAETIWVSPGTYLPVRVAVRPAPGGPGLQQTADITWLAPTTQNLAKLTVPVPAGFRKVTFSQVGTPILRQLPARLLPTPASPCPSPAGPACMVSGTPRPFPTPAPLQPAR
jgi:hypothetical protein